MKTIGGGRAELWVTLRGLLEEPLPLHFFTPPHLNPLPPILTPYRSILQIQLGIYPALGAAISLVIPTVRATEALSIPTFSREI